MKKLLTAAVAVIFTLISLASLAACKDENKQILSGTDEYGRTLGEVYDIDSEETGAFRLSYATGDTSTIGKTMISSNCAEYVKVEKTSDGYFLTFYCKSGMLGKVALVRESGKTQGTQGEEDGYQSYSFAVAKEELGAKIALECEVKLMNKTVAFSITVDQNSAVLVG